MIVETFQESHYTQSMPVILPPDKIFQIAYSQPSPIGWYPWVHLELILQCQMTQSQHFVCFHTEKLLGSLFHMASIHLEMLKMELGIGLKNSLHSALNC
uniref:Uncharacterized protein n=1 Tax=Rhizophora mucronata TaxID=61149 RepID=A0A2P2QP32_RHIMU